MQCINDAKDIHVKKFFQCQDVTEVNQFETFTSLFEKRRTPNFILKLLFEF